jgi:hypothetical protein
MCAVFIALGGWKMSDRFMSVWSTAEIKWNRTTPNLTAKPGRKVLAKAPSV